MSGASGLRKHGHTATGDGGALGSVSPTALVIPAATSPAQTAEGSAVWDSDDDKLTVGTGAARKTLVNEGAVTTAGLTQATSRLLGRTSASTGAIEEISAGSGLSLAGGVLATTGGGGGSSRWVDYSTDGVALDTGIANIWDANLDAKVVLDGSITFIAGTGWGIEFDTDNGKVIEFFTDALVLPNQGSDPTLTDDGAIFYNSTAHFIKARIEGNILKVPWMGESGSATITTGNTSVTVTHGNPFNPVDARGVDVWPINNPTNDPGWFWVSNVGGVSFDINVRANPGASGAIFAWRIVPR